MRSEEFRQQVSEGGGDALGGSGQLGVRSGGADGDPIGVGASAGFEGEGEGAEEAGSGFE